MSISTNIDGSLGSNQVIDLLSILTGTPEVYASKLKALQDATEANKKYVEAIGPASEIVRIKTEIAQTQSPAEFLETGNFIERFSP